MLGKQRAPVPQQGHQEQLWGTSPTLSSFPLSPAEQVWKAKLQAEHCTPCWSTFPGLPILGLSQIGMCLLQEQHNSTPVKGKDALAL